MLTTYIPMKNSKISTYTLYTLCTFQVATVLLSLVLSALFPSSSIRSLLSAEAIRWLCNHFAGFCASPWLIWIILLGMAFGCCHASGIISTDAIPHTRRRRALYASAITLAGGLIVTAVLTVAPHAVLRSATGMVFPSPFSSALAGISSILVAITSIVYGVTAGTFSSTNNVVKAVFYGVSVSAPLIVIYIFLVTLVHSIMYMVGM